MSGPPHVLHLWLGVSSGVLPVRYLPSYNVSFTPVKFHGGHKVEVNLVTLILGVLWYLEQWCMSEYV